MAVSGRNDHFTECLPNSVKRVAQRVTCTRLFGLRPEQGREGIARVESARAGEHEVHQHRETPGLGEERSRRIVAGADDTYWAENL